MKHLVGPLLVIAWMSSCASTFELPGPYSDQGLRVEATGYYYVTHGLTRKIHGIEGLATNETGQDLGMVVLNFDVLDDSGVKVADAMASTSNLEAGGTWQFQAVMMSPFGSRVSRIEPGSVTMMTKAGGAVETRSVGVELAGPTEVKGVRIELHEVTSSPVGGNAWCTVRGTAQNTTDTDYSMCLITLALLEDGKAQVGSAVASTPGLQSGRSWKFEATALVGSGAELARVEVASVSVLPVGP